eukprot:347075-Chlamydomonas_euryale.AAC.8
MAAGQGVCIWSVRRAGDSWAAAAGPAASRLSSTAAAHAAQQRCRYRARGSVASAAARSVRRLCAAPGVRLGSRGHPRGVHATAQEAALTAGGAVDAVRRASRLARGEPRRRRSERVRKAVIDATAAPVNVAVFFDLVGGSVCHGCVDAAVGASRRPPRTAKQRRPPGARRQTHGDGGAQASASCCRGRPPRGRAGHGGNSRVAVARSCFVHLLAAAPRMHHGKREKGTAPAAARAAVLAAKHSSRKNRRRVPSPFLHQLPQRWPSLGSVPRRL